MCLLGNTQSEESKNNWSEKKGTEGNCECSASDQICNYYCLKPGEDWYDGASASHTPSASAVIAIVQYYCTKVWLAHEFSGGLGGGGWKRRSRDDNKRYCLCWQFHIIYLLLLPPSFLPFPTLLPSTRSFASLTECQGAEPSHLMLQQAADGSGSKVFN